MISPAPDSTPRENSKISDQGNEMYTMIYMQPWVISVKLVKLAPGIVSSPWVKYLKQMSGKT